VDFELSESDRELGEGVRRLCEGVFPLEQIRALESTERVIDRKGWRQLGEAGVFHLRLPEEAGGVDIQPGSIARRAGDRLPASYINFYVANKYVVMPLYDKRWDSAARATLRRLFPTREVVGVETREVLLGGGNIHCITQQVPAVAGNGSR